MSSTNVRTIGAGLKEVATDPEAQVLVAGWDPGLRCFVRAAEVLRAGKVPVNWSRVVGDHVLSHSIAGERPGVRTETPRQILPFFGRPRLQYSQA